MDAYQATMAEDIDVGGAVGADIGVRNPRAASPRRGSVMEIHGTHAADAACLLVGCTVLQSRPQPNMGMHVLMLRSWTALSVAGRGKRRPTTTPTDLRTRMEADFGVGAGVLVGCLEGSVEV